jgi:formylmethanofuran dehydrogenase subunit C
MERIVDGYRRLVEEEIKDLVWLVEHSRVARAYSAAAKSIQDLSYDQDDIEDFCAEIDNSEKIPYIISGPAGIYVSALINHVKEDRMTLRLEDYQQTYHFLGYRLPEGKTLVLQGNVGDFIGAGLSGGHLVVEGSTGNWCGAGMTRGEILITGFTGLNTGEQMRGGEIHVDGRIRSVGRTIFGGRIYQRGQLIAP